MTYLPLFTPPTTLDVIISPWRYLWEFLPAILLIGALNIAVVLITILLIRRFFGKKKK